MNTRNVHRFCPVYAVLLLDLLLFGSLSAQGRYQNTNFVVQASLFQEAKGYMTTSQEKISSDLLQLIDQRFLPQGTSLQSHAETMKNLKQLRSKQATVFSAESIKEGEVYVYIHLAPGGQTETLSPLVSRITDVDESNHLAVAWVKVKNLESLASLNAVETVRSVVPPVNKTGSVTTEGDVIHKTADVRSTYSQAGSGIKVGIISNGVDHRSSSQSTNDLPADGSGLTVRSNSVGGDEGTAMLEIVHDMVPSADLYFHDQGTNVVAFDNAIDDLVSAGCKVICDDVGWITQPFFEDGTVASHVASVLSGNNIVYVSSAGNAGNTHYQGDYYPITSSTQHDFSHGSTSTPYLYIHMSSGANVRVVLQWNDQFGSSGNDYDLSLMRISSGSTVATSFNRQDGNDDPLEAFSYTAFFAGDYAVIVDKYSGSTKTLEVYIYPGSGVSVYSNNITPVDAIFGHPAVSGVLAVGAVDEATPSSIENFSSQGPATIAYPSAAVRDKPDIVGVDGVKITGAGSFGYYDGTNWRFYGTSAAAPHIAAVIAQLWAELPDRTGNDIRDMVKATAADLGGTGFDYVYGSGRADALNAFNTYVVLPIQLASLTASVVRNNDVEVAWKTVSETNNYGFEIYRRRTNSGLNDDNPQWTKIAFVEGHGTTLAPQSYSYVDKSVGFGRYLYQIKQVDLDGKSEVFPEMAVTVGLLPQTLTLAQNYPNPFNPSTQIEFVVPQSGYASVKVYNLLGQEVATVFAGSAEAETINTARLDATNLPSGIYYYMLRSAGKMDTKRMVLMK
jgi:hypothetical protein